MQSEGKDISSDLEHHIARADRNYLKDGIHRAVITTPGCYMVTTVDKAEKTMGATLYRTDSKPKATGNNAMLCGVRGDGK